MWIKKVLKQVISSQLLVVAVVGAASLTLSIPQAVANHENNDNTSTSANNKGQRSAGQWNDKHIIVFSECGFRGLSKSIPVGDYEALQQIGIEHNAISSIIIPDGMATEVFQRHHFGGHWYRLNKTQECLPGKWNNRIGSLRVLPDRRKNSFGFTNGYQANADHQDDVVFGANGWDNTPGFGKRYSSGVHGGENWGNDYKKGWAQRIANQNNSGGSNSGGNCVKYTVSGNHPDTGLRFLVGDQKFVVAGNGERTGQICHTGAVQVELAKKRPPAQVVLRIGGGTYVFRGNDTGDKLQNGWYRKYFNVVAK